MSIVARQTVAFAVALLLLGAAGPTCPRALASPILPGNSIASRPAGWEESKEYSAWVAGGAVVAAKAAADAARTWLADAQRRLADARSLSGAAAAARGISAGTVAALAAEVVSAEAAVAAATSAAGVATAVAAGAVIGTGLGQIANAGIAAIWDLFASSDLPQPVDPTQIPIYVPPSPQELRELTTTLLSDAGFAPIDFEGAGESGLASRRFIEEGAGVVLIALRGAAAGANGRTNELASAAADLVGALTTYRDAAEDVSRTLSVTAFQSPVAEVSNARNRFESIVGGAKADCAASGEDCSQLFGLLDEAMSSFAAAETFAASGRYPHLVNGDDPLFSPLTLGDFTAFVESTATLGVGALPLEEVAMAERFVASAGVFFPHGSDFPSLIAQWVALTDIEEQSRHFPSPTGILRIDEILHLSATTKSCGQPGCVGPWLRMNPYESELVKSQVPEPATSILIVLGLAGLVWIGRQKR